MAAYRSPARRDERFIEYLFGKKDGKSSERAAAALCKIIQG